MLALHYFTFLLYDNCIDIGIGICIAYLLGETTLSSVFELQMSGVYNSHDTTGSSSTGVTSLQRVGVSTLSEIIGTGVYNDSSANDGLGAKEGDVLVC